MWGFAIEKTRPSWAAWLKGPLRSAIMEKGPSSASQVTCALCSLPSRGALSAVGADRKERGGPWIATAGIIRNGEQPGSGVHGKSGVIITAAHLTAIDATMSVRIAGVICRRRF